MRPPQGFKRVPVDESNSDQDIILPEYPSQTKTKTKGNLKGNYFAASTEPCPAHTDMEYSAMYTAPYRKPLVERLEEYEHRLFSTQFFSIFYNNFVSGWHAGLIRAFVLSSCAFIFNIVIYAWLYSTHNTRAGTATIMNESCTKVQNANIVVHAGLNVISTMVLGASTYAMQGMTAPTREEVDEAHAKGIWLEIGTHSVRNLFHVKKRNLWIWMLLALTSMPLHLFFNAVFFTTSQTNQYAVAVVSRNIFTNATFEPTEANSSPDLFEQWYGDCEGAVCSFDLRKNSTVIELIQNATNMSRSTEYVRMEPMECLQNYSSGFMRSYGDVLVVSSHSDTRSSVLWTRYPQSNIHPDKANTNGDPFHWVCHDAITSKRTEEDRCSLESAQSDWNSRGNWTVYNSPVDYCLARVAPRTCQLQFNAWLMCAVVVLGFIKTVVIAVLVSLRISGHALRTIGDTIASYLKEEDPTTKNMCLVTSKQIRKHGFKAPYEPQIYTGARPRWFSGANTTEFFSTIGVSALYIVVLSIALFFAINGAHGTAFSNGLGVADIQSLAYLKADDTGSSGIVPTLLVTNIPQLGFSFLYIVYANLYGKLLAARQFDILTQRKRGLRVSERPRGMQRANHIFTLPARFALPLLACSAALHYFCSASFFMVRIDGVNSHYETDTKDQLVRLGYSATGVVSLIGVSVGMLVSTVFVSSYKRLNTNLGETSMSVIISAACHLKRHDTEPWLQELQWGDVSGNAENRESGEEQGVRHIAFTAQLAGQAIVGQAYQ
jgi:hypothetical protein